MTQIETITLFDTIEIAARRAAEAVKRNDTDEVAVCFHELTEALEKIVDALTAVSKPTCRICGEEGHVWQRCGND